MTQANALIGLLAETSLHPGSGSSTGIIDLPIQREGHTGWPCIFGSAVKGAMRDAYETQFGKQDRLTSIIFGPDPKDESDHAGALAISDARLLLLPVRSLTSQFKWVTCPAALQRLKRDITRMGHPTPTLTTIEMLSTEQAITHGNNAETLFLEEYRFNVATTDLSDTISCLCQLMELEGAQALLQQQLVIIHDDMFTHLANHATPVNAHIRIAGETKTVEDGALWYEETLPPETLLYTCLSANNARQKAASQDANTILGSMKDKLFKTRPYLQLGGNETVGMGWCITKFYQTEAQ